MPTLYYNVEAPGVNILKIVQDEVIFGLLDELDLIRYFQDLVYIYSSFTTASQYDDGQGAVSVVKNRCDVTAEYVMDKSQVPWPVETPYTTAAYGVRSTKKGNYTPILIDTDAGIHIEHRTIACAINMDFRLTFQTFDDACKAFDTIQTKYKGSLIQTPFDLSFAYPVSMGLFKYLMAVYQAKTSYSTKDFMDYINDTKQTEISWDYRKSQLIESDADKQLMIRCQQLGCLAQLTMDQKEPEAQLTDQLADGYTINFNLVIQFGRPNIVVVNTPVAVDNTVLPYGLFENSFINYHYNPSTAGIYQDLLCNEFMKRSYGDFNRSSQIIRMPVYDDWFSVDRQYVAYKYRPFLIAHFTLDGPTTTLDLKQLDDVVLHPIVQKIFKATGSSIFNYGGLFNVGVYANNLRLGNELVSIDENLILTVQSNRLDKNYHLVLSETTDIQKTDPIWDSLLIKYRYFFPLTIERNLKTLIDKRYFTIDYDNALLNLIDKLHQSGIIKQVLKTMVDLGEINNEIYSYTQNPSQLADYLAYTASWRTDYSLPVGTDPTSIMIREYYGTVESSVDGRSLLVAFIEQCLIFGFITLDTIPSQYLKPSTVVYPYSALRGGFYGFNTPIRVFNYNIRTE